MMDLLRALLNVGRENTPGEVIAVLVSVVIVLAIVRLFGPT